MSDSPPRAPSPPQAPHVAHVEDFDENEQTTVPETKKSANIAAKRSKAESSKPKAYEFSDSGYSSHTGATLDSSLESKVDQNAPAADTTAAPSNPNLRGGDGPSQNNAHIQRDPSLRRTQSKSRRNDEAREKDCWCEECVAKRHRSSASRETHRPPKHVGQQPKPKAQEPVSQPSRRPSFAPAAHEAPVLRERTRRPSTSQRPRPMSIHAGAIPEPMFLAQPIATQPVFIERQQPSTHLTPYTFPPPSYPPPQPAYYPPIQRPPPPQDLFVPVSPYDMHPRPLPQPTPRQWVHELPPQPPPPRPRSAFYPPPSPIEYAQPIPQAYTSVAAPPRSSEQRHSRRDRAQPPPEERSTRRRDTEKMPPPPPPALPRAETRYPQEQRPSMRHAATTSGPYPHLSHRRSGQDENRDVYKSSRSSGKPSFEDHERSRRPSLARPGKSSDDKVVSFGSSIEKDMARMNIETGGSGTRQKRRSSVYNHEFLRDREASIEAYQASKGTVPRATPRHSEDDMLRLVRKKTHTSSDAGSRVSGHSGTSRRSRGSRDGSDMKAQDSTSRRPSMDTKSRSSNENFAMRFSTSQDINFDLGRVAEGRSINLRQTKDADGEMELSIGNNSRGRVVGSRPAIREQSRKRYSIVDGEEGVRQIEPARTPSRPRREIKEEEEDEEPERRIIGERIRTTIRRRGSSRYGYEERMNMF